MQLSNDTEWSKSEKEIARQAFKVAYEREIQALIAEVRGRSSSLREVNDLWQLHDFLSARRHDIDGKYDFRYSILIFVFAGLVREGWLKLEELNGLEPAKVTKISALAQM